MLTKSNDPSPDRVLFVDMHLTATRTCSIVHGAYNKHALCAKSPQSAKGLCKGDSGAPLFCNGNTLPLYFYILRVTVHEKLQAEVQSNVTIFRQLEQQYNITEDQ
uniref:Peptidase S1 domain-containing protein n=1 Tax=Glossina pallidipes TaxID=7398 RepID=A0A1A9Z401_GLOPL